MDKRSCDNCTGHCRDCKSGRTAWQRDPTKWLSILPTELGWYFMKKKNDTNYTIRYLFQDEIASSRFDGAGFYFQGPVVPHGEQHK